MMQQRLRTIGMSFLGSRSLQNCKAQSCNLVIMQAPLSSSSRSFFNLSFSSSKKKHYERRLLPFSQEQCYDVVADVSRYSEFVPWVQESVITKKVAGSNIIEADLVVGFNLMNFNERYTSIVTLNHPSCVTAVSRQTNLFENLETEWRFAPSSDQKSCWVTFRIEFEFKSSAYNQASTLFMNEIVAKQVKAFENQCKKRYSR